MYQWRKKLDIFQSKDKKAKASEMGTSYLKSTKVLNDYQDK